MSHPIATASAAVTLDPQGPERARVAVIRDGIGVRARNGPVATVLYRYEPGMPPLVAAFAVSGEHGSNASTK